MTGLSGHDPHARTETYLDRADRVSVLSTAACSCGATNCCSPDVPGAHYDRAGSDSSETPDCPCKAAAQPVYEAVGVLHLVDCPWLAWFRSWGGCMGDV